MGTRGSSSFSYEGVELNSIFNLPGPVLTRHVVRLFLKLSPLLLGFAHCGFVFWSWYVKLEKRSLQADLRAPASA